MTTQGRRLLGRIRIAYSAIHHRPDFVLITARRFTSIFLSRQVRYRHRYCVVYCTGLCLASLLLLDRSPLGISVGSDEVRLQLPILLEPRTKTPSYWFVICVHTCIWPAAWECRGFTNTRRGYCYKLYLYLCVNRALGIFLVTEPEQVDFTSFNTCRQSLTVCVLASCCKVYFTQHIMQFSRMI